MSNKNKLQNDSKPQSCDKLQQQSKNNQFSYNTNFVFESSLSSSLSGNFKQCVTVVNDSNNLTKNTFNKSTDSLSTQLEIAEINLKESQEEIKKLKETLYQLIIQRDRDLADRNQEIETLKEKLAKSGVKDDAVVHKKEKTEVATQKESVGIVINNKCEIS